MQHTFSTLRHTLAVLAMLLLALVLALFPNVARSQTETLFQTVGADTARNFAHASLPGAVGIDFSFSFAIAPAYPPDESHTLVVVFEWGPTAAGPWTASPDNVRSIPGAVTAFWDSGIFHGPEDAPFVQIHFYAGALMTVSGTFTHASVVPEPASLALWLAGLLVLGGSRHHVVGAAGFQRLLVRRPGVDAGQPVDDSRVV